MRTIPDDVRERLLAVMRESRAEKLDSEETGRRLLAVDPDHPPGLLALGSARLAANDLDEAEGLLWRALAGAPTQPGYYFPLAALYRERGDADLSSRFVLLAMWKLSLYEQVPEGMAAAIQKAFPPLEDADLSPEVFEDAAEQIEAGLQGPCPERLLPYWLLNEVQRGALGGLDPDMVRQIVGEAATCGPVFEAAVHEVYATKQSTLSVDSEALLTALLGEIGGVELIDDLIGADPDPLELFLHAHWAVRRLGQRFPEEAFARLRVAAAGVDYDVRAAIAEQLYFLPESAGARRAIGELLDGFEGGDEEAAYLLLTVSTLENSVETLKRHERQLSKEGRRWLREALEGDGEWAPELMAAGIDELDIDAVCVDLALIEDDEPGHEHDDDEEEFEEPEPVAKPGRNDPCWCGSGKKYKKCHLQDDEQRAREGESQAPVNDLYQAGWGQLLDASSHYYSHAETKRAMRLYADRDISELTGEMLADLGFFEWFLLDYRSERSGRTVAEEFLRRRGARLTDRARTLMESWAASRYGLWEVVRIEANQGMELRDAFEGDTLFVENVVQEEDALKPGDFVLHRVHRFDDAWQFAGRGVLVGSAAVQSVREELERGRGEAGQTPGAYFRSRSHEWRRFVMEAQADDAG